MPHCLTQDAGTTTVGSPPQPVHVWGCDNPQQGVAWVHVLEATCAPIAYISMTSMGVYTNVSHSAIQNDDFYKVPSYCS